MRDSDIRQALKTYLKDLHRSDPDTLIVDELGLFQGAARVDVAVINHQITGYEIKSDQDTLTRLPVQVRLFSRVLDQAVLIAGTNHLKAALEMVPPWWGIQEAAQVEGKIVLIPRREPAVNPEVDPFALAQLLWRDEALAILKDHGLDRGLRSKPRRVLWHALAAHLSIEDLRSAVCSTIKTRKNWREVPT